MPAVSKKQQRYMGMCAHSDNPPDSCPDKQTAREFSHKPKGGYKKRKRAYSVPRKDSRGFY